MVKYDMPWFTSLTKTQRKEVLFKLHLRRQSLPAEQAEALSEEIKHLEEIHHSIDPLIDNVMSS